MPGIREERILRSNVGFMALHGGSQDRGTDQIARRAAENRRVLLRHCPAFLAAGPPHLTVAQSRRLCASAVVFEARGRCHLSARIRARWVCPLARSRAGRGHRTVRACNAGRTEGTIARDHRGRFKCAARRRGSRSSRSVLPVTTSPTSGCGSGFILRIRSTFLGPWRPGRAAAGSTRNRRLRRILGFPAGATRQRGGGCAGRTGDTRHRIVTHDVGVAHRAFAPNQGPVLNAQATPHLDLRRGSRMRRTK